MTYSGIHKSDIYIYIYIYIYIHIHNVTNKHFEAQIWSENYFQMICYILITAIDICVYI